MIQLPDPLKDVIAIRQSILETKDMNKLINIVAYRPKNKRQIILNLYNNKYNRNLLEDIKTKLYGYFKEAILGLFYTPIDYDCNELYLALNSFLIEKDVIIEILATRNNFEILEIRKRYSELFGGKDLVKKIKDKTSGFFGKILLILLEGKRSNNFQPDENECEQSAKILFKAGKQGKEKAREIYLKILTEKSNDEFELIYKCYQKLYGKTLLEENNGLFTGDTR